MQLAENSTNSKIINLDTPKAIVPYGYVLNKQLNNEI